MTHTFLVPVDASAALCARGRPGVGASPPCTRSSTARRRSAMARRRAAHDALRAGAAPGLRDVRDHRRVHGAASPTRPDRTATARSARPAAHTPGWSVEIHDPATGAPVPTGEFGEVWTRSGAELARATTGSPEETAELLRRRRLAAHRRRRPPRRRRLPLPHRPGEGHDHHRRGERLPRRGRAGAAPRTRRSPTSSSSASPTRPGARPSSPWSSCDPASRPHPESIIEATARRAGRLQASPSRSTSSTSCRATRRARSLTAAATGAAGYRRSVRRNSMSVEPVRILGFVNHIAPVAGHRGRRSRGRSSGASTSSWRRAPAATGARTGSAPASRSRPTRRPTWSPTCARRCRARRAVRLLVRDRRRRRRTSRPACEAFDALCAPQRVVARRRRRPVGGRHATCCWRRIAGGQPVVPGGPGRGAVAAAHRRRRRRRRADRGPDRPRAGDGGARPRRRRCHHRTGARHRSVHGAADAARYPDGRRRASPASCWSAAASRWSPATRAGASGPASTRPGSRSGRRRRTPGATVRSLVSHTFYERSHPTQEENPGGAPRPRRRRPTSETPSRHPLRGCPLGRGAVHRADGRARGARGSGR